MDPIKFVDRSLWLNDGDVASCPSCKSEFGLFLRRHHCRVCGGVFCNTCSGLRVLGERCCRPCFQTAKSSSNSGPKRTPVFTEPALRKDEKKATRVQHVLDDSYGSWCPEPISAYIDIEPFMQAAEAILQGTSHAIQSNETAETPSMAKEGNKDDTLAKLGMTSLPTTATVSRANASHNNPETKTNTTSADPVVDADMNTEQFESLLIRACVCLESGNEVDLSTVHKVLILMNQFRKNPYIKEPLRITFDTSSYLKSVVTTDGFIPEEQEDLYAVDSSSQATSTSISAANRHILSGASSALLKNNQTSLSEAISSPRERARLPASSIFSRSLIIQTAEQIIMLFNDFRFSHPPGHDMFEALIERPNGQRASGRHLFTRMLLKSIFNQKPIQFILPAFPCKSPNQQDKVVGIYPDLGEQLALDRIGAFCDSIQRIYPPGAKCIIFSDGRVFADLVGVPPHHVDIYWSALQALRHSPSIEFVSLDDKLDDLMNLLNQDTVALDDVRKGDLFDPMVKDIAPYACASHLRSLKSKTDSDGLSSEMLKLNFEQKVFISEKNREEFESTVPEVACKFVTDQHCQIQSFMFKIWQKEEELKQLEVEIVSDANGDSAVLLRGFMKFLLADRDWSSSFSKSAVKKYCSMVAKRMIVRNKNLSKFVNELYPEHIRLSIHPHNNMGPKFACRLIQDVPYCVTPWHNATVRLLDGTHALLRKRDIVDKLNVVSERRDDYPGIWCYVQVARDRLKD